MKFVEKRERKQKDGYINRTEHKTYKWIWLRTYPFFGLPPAGRKKAHNFFETACHNHSPLFLLVSFFLFFCWCYKTRKSLLRLPPWEVIFVSSVSVTVRLGEHYPRPCVYVFFLVTPFFFMLPPFFCFYASTQLALQEQQERSHDVVKVQGEDPATPGPLTSKMTPGP